MEKVKRIWNAIKEVIALVASVITIVLFIIDAKEYAFWIVLALIFWGGIIVLSAIIPIFSTKRANKRIRKEFYKKETLIYSDIHKYLHSLRDYTASIDVNKRANKQELNKTCELLCASINEVFLEAFKGVLKSGETVSVCVKTVKAESISDTDYKNWRLETFGRSPSTLADRKRADLNDILIADNTDFLVIVEGKTSFISFTDMSNIDDCFLKKYKTEYKNSRKDFIQYYKSCIIIPIEIGWENASEKVRKTLSLSRGKKLLLGFLCIDSMKAFVTEEEIKVFERGIEIAKAFGDSLYLFFEKVLMIQMKDK